MATVIVGASQGLGEALAIEFYSRKHKVLAASRNESKLRQLKDKCPNMHICPCDVTNLESVKALVKFAVDTFGNVQTVIFNAGVNFDYLIADWEDTETFQEVININLVGAANILHGFLSPLCACPNSCFVAVTSLAGVLGCVPGGTAYAASKAGLDAFMSSAAPELRSLGVKVLIVDPGSMLMPGDTQRQVLGSGSRYREARRDRKGRPVGKVAETICTAVETGREGRIWSTYRVGILAGLFLKLFLPSQFEKLSLRVRFKQGGRLPFQLRKGVTETSNRDV